MKFHEKDIQILQQSQSKLALHFLTSHNITPTAEELWRVTEVFVELCLRPQDQDLKDRIKKLDKWIVDKNKVKV